MRLMDEDELLPALQRRLSSSNEASVAIAWVRIGRPLDALLAFATKSPGKLRVLCGVNGFLTEPAALFELSRVAKLKIAYGTAGTKFHTKLFLFSSAEGTICWVGSANLTQSAFTSNRELVCEFMDDGSAAAIFERYWVGFVEPDQAWLDSYAAAHQRLPKLSSTIAQIDGPEMKTVVPIAWTDYVSQLRAKNSRRLEWVAQHLPEVTAIGRSNWQQLTRDDAEKLLGIPDGYGGLGRLIGAGKVKNIFYEASWRNLQKRQTIADALDVIPLDSNALSFEPMLVRAFDLVTSLDRVSVATVSRLLAVRHPDRFVSVNGASIAGFSRLSGISQRELGSARGYASLIRWVMSQEWWRCADPLDETSIYWRSRAALLDIFVYSGDPETDEQSEIEYDSASE